MNPPVKMSHPPPPLVPRNNSINSPSPSSPLTVKMNGSIPPPPVPVGRAHNGLPTMLNKHPGSNTPTKQTFDMSANDSKMSHSLLHDTSQEMMSRSVLSATSAGPRLRTPNPIPIPTPTPTAPSSTTMTGTVPSPTLMISPVVGLTATGAGSGSTTSATRMIPEAVTERQIFTISKSDKNHGNNRCCNLTAHEALSSLALLAVVSVLLASLAVVFLLKVMSFALLDKDGKPVNIQQDMCNRSSVGFVGWIVDANEFRLVYEIVVGLTTCTISLDFTCTLICCAQFIFASKLAKAPQGQDRALQYLKLSSFSRVIAIGGFFISIPVFLTGIILYAFIHFEAKSAIITSLLIGLSIVFCGLAMIHNVYVWQQQKTKASKMSPSINRVHTPLELKLQTSNSEQSSSQGLDVTQNASMELSTLV